MGVTLKTCALLTVTVVTVLAMNAQAHSPSCVTVEEHELAKRDLNRLNAEIWDLKAKHTGTTDDMKDIAEAAEKEKTYQGCPKCPKCPKRNLRHLLDHQECVSPSTYTKHLALLKEIEIAKDKLKKLKSEYKDVRRDFRASKKAYCLCDPCHVTTPEPVAAAPTMPPIPLHPCTGEEISLDTTELKIEKCDGNMTVGLPSALGLLSELTHLSVDILPLLTGTLPTELGMLSKLQNLYFYDDPLLTGTLPTELGMLSKLQEAGFYRVPLLIGTLPTELGMLSMFEQAYFYTLPLLTGTLPTELGMLSMMSILNIDDLPRLTGTLPTELGLASKLEDLQVRSCPLVTGTLPTELDSLTSLTVLDLTGTSITTDFNPQKNPPQLAALTSLTYCADKDGKPGKPCFAGAS